MAQHNATIKWQRGDNESYLDNKYSRAHRWQFDGGAQIAASSSPSIVAVPYSVAENVDPEEAFVASLSSCHMLFFLSIAAGQGWIVDLYEDKAIGTMAKDIDGNISMTKVVLRPLVRFSQVKQPNLEQLEQMHHLAHQKCFIANSVKTEVVTEIVC